MNKIAHGKVEIKLPLAKVYQALSKPVDFPKFLEAITHVDKINTQTYDFECRVDENVYKWSVNIIDMLKNTRFAWITVTGDINQTGTILFTPLNNGQHTRVDFTLACNTFFDNQDEDETLKKLIEEYPRILNKGLELIKELLESDKFKDAQPLKPSVVSEG